MKNWLISLTVALLFLSACSTTALLKTPEQTLRLEMYQNSGHNASTVAFDPQLKRYYSVYCGNKKYALRAYDEQGKTLKTIEAGHDMRGIWYNPETKELEGNVYDGKGLVKMSRRPDGIPESKFEITLNKSMAPTVNAVGTYDTKNKAIIYREDNKITMFDASTGESKGEVTLALPVEPTLLSKHNVYYTGVTGQEYSVYNFEARTLYFFNESGALTGEIAIPGTITVTKNFNTGFANKHFFLFSKSDKVWVGYKVFK